MSEPLYHGTDIASEINIINNGIDVNYNPKGGDFGVGFYLTPELKSAKDMALRKAFVNMQPSVIELTMKKNYRNIVEVKDFGCITLKSSDSEIIEWAQFVVNNRCGMDYIQKVSVKSGYENNNLDKRYDIVIGPIADGSVTKTARRCKAENRIVTVSEAKEFLDKSFGMQYCISTEKGLSAIDNLPRAKKGVLWK